jgi:hypothetical protein
LTREILLSRAGEKRINDRMKTFQSWFFKILWWLTFVVVVFTIIVVASREWIVKELMEQHIRVITGMEPEIRDFSFSVLDPKVTFENFKLYNTVDYGGTLFLDMPELHIEYDRAALRRHELHITFLRLNVNELDVVRNEDGTTNIFSLAKIVAPEKSAGGGRTFAPLNGYRFTGIDFMNISIGTAKFIDLKNPSHNHALALHIENQTVANVKSPADLAGLESLIWLRGGYWVGLPGSRPKHTISNIGGTNAVNTP